MMKAPAFFFPTSTVIVDDDNLYARLLVDSLKNCPPIQTSSNFEFLLKQKDNDFLFIDGENQNIEEDDIKQCITNKKNTLDKVISVVIADLHMDGMNGLELFRQINSPYVFKILISNFIDNEDVKAARNDGVIDVDLEKGPDLKNKLPAAIFAGQSKFFTLLSNKVFALQETQRHLDDTSFSNIFAEIMSNFRPDYIWPEEDLSSFIFEKKNAKHRKKLFVTTKNEINTLLDGDNAETAPKKAAELLKTGNFMLCHKNPHLLDGQEWAYFLRDAKKIEGYNSTFLYHAMEESE